MAPPRRILDSHIHLWPHAAADSSAHAWMVPGSHLARQYSLDDYRAASAGAPVVGAVYVETDRRLKDAPSASASSAAADVDVLERAAGPLDEMRWLRHLVEGTPGDALLWGLVPWAPVDAGLPAFRRYVDDAAARLAGGQTWARVVGWRFLVQGLRDEAAFGRVVESAAWADCLRECGRRGWCFDVGVDARQGGVWQVERAVEMVERVNAGVKEEGEEVRFILNHLCKPDMEQLPTTPDQLDGFDRWAASMERAAKSKHVYMKLSGAFSEMADQEAAAPWAAAAVVERMKPWLDQLFRFFPPERIMFGSDWPICNVRGPGDGLAWRSWRAAVEEMLETYGLSDEQRDSIWFGTAVEAYRLNPPSSKASLAMK